MKSENVEKLWMTLAIDPIEMQVFVVGFSETEDDCKHHNQRIATPYMKSFELSDEVGDQVHKWFCLCGMTTSDAAKSVREVGRTLVAVTNFGKDITLDR